MQVSVAGVLWGVGLWVGDLVLVGSLAAAALQVLDY